MKLPSYSSHSNSKEMGRAHLRCKGSCTCNDTLLEGYQLDKVGATGGCCDAFVYEETFCYRSSTTGGGGVCKSLPSTSLPCVLASLPLQASVLDVQSLDVSFIYKLVDQPSQPPAASNASTNGSTSSSSSGGGGGDGNQGASPQSSTGSAQAGGAAQKQSPVDECLVEVEVAKERSVDGHKVKVRGRVKGLGGEEGVCF